MADGSFLQWLTSPAPPLYALALGCAVLAVRFYPLWKAQWIAARTAEDTIVGNQWKRFQEEIERLDARCERLEASEERCRQDLGDAKRRIAELEGYDEGQGRARQEAADIVARERLADKGMSGGAG